MILPNGEELSPLIEPVIVTSDYYLGIEQIADMTFVHATVFAGWSPRIARQFRADLARLATRHNPLFAFSHQPHAGDHAKFRKFVRLMGFEPYRTVRGSDGADHAIFVRRG